MKKYKYLWIILIYILFIITFGLENYRKENRQRSLEGMNQELFETHAKDIHINTPNMGSSYSGLEDTFYYYGYGLWINDNDKNKSPAIHAATTWLISRLIQWKLIEAVIDRNHPIVYQVN